MSITGPLLALAGFMATVLLLLALVAVGATGARMLRDRRENRALLAGAEAELRRAARLPDDVEAELRRAAELQRAIDDWETSHQDSPDT